MRHYTKGHEWIALEGEIATIGISAYAQRQLGKISFVEVPEKGQQVEAGKEAAVIESAKAASEIYAPLSGTVTEGNPLLAKQPELVNTAPEGEGWLYRLKLANKAEVGGMMDAAAYQEYIKDI